MNDIYGEHGPDFYARFYSYPSALLHGDALMSMDVMEVLPDGTWVVHGTSRRQNTDEDVPFEDVLFNYVVFFLTLLIDAVRAFGIEDSNLLAFSSRLDADGVALGMEIIEPP